MHGSKRKVFRNQFGNTKLSKVKMIEAMSGGDEAKAEDLKRRLATAQNSTSPSMFDEVDRLCAVADPDTTPYVSKYAAVALLKKMREEGGAGDGDEDPMALVKRMLRRRARVDCRMAQIHLDTEEPHEAEMRLEDALDVLEPKEWKCERSDRGSARERMRRVHARGVVLCG